MSGDSGVTVVTMLVVLFTFCTRGCGRIVRPAFPAPSDFEGQDSKQNSRENARRDREVVARRHCEERLRRSNPLFLCRAIDCFAEPVIDKAFGGVARLLRPAKA